MADRMPPPLVWLKWLLRRGSRLARGPCLIERLALPPRRTHVAGMSETLLDVKGMNCPLPVLRANRALRTMAAGERLRVLATDRASVADFHAFCQETGHALLAWSEEAGVFSFVIRRRAEKPDSQQPDGKPPDGKPPTANPQTANPWAANPQAGRPDGTQRPDRKDG